MTDLTAMLPLAADWTTISSLATGAGTLVLAIATFASVKSANRSARVAEEALLEQRRPILTQSRLDDPVQKIMFVEGRWVAARGGHGVAQHDGSVYFAMSLRNVGAGIAVCQGWHVTAGRQSARDDHAPEDAFRLQTRDLYIPAGDIGMWQGALRDRNDPTFQAAAAAIDRQDIITIELHYSDQVGEQRTISRFGLVPYEWSDEHGETRIEWFATINRHWYLDRMGPRADDQVAAAADVILHEQEIADQLARSEAEAAAAQQDSLEREPAAETEATAVVETPAGIETPGGGEAGQTNGAEAGQTNGGDVDGAARVPSRIEESVTVVPRPNCE